MWAYIQGLSTNMYETEIQKIVFTKVTSVPPQRFTSSNTY